MPLRYEIQTEGGEPVGVRVTSADSTAPWSDVDGATARAALRRMRGKHKLPERCGLQVDASGDVVGHAIVPAEADFAAMGLVEVDRATLDKSRAGGRTIRGTDLPRWRWSGGGLVENVDTRPTGTWSETAIDVAQGAPSPTVTLTVSQPVNGQRTLSIGGRVFSLQFSAGVATVSIPTGKPGVYTFADSEELRLTNALRVRVGRTALQV